MVNQLIPEDVSDTYLVGHSLGGAFIIFLLQQWHGYIPFSGILLVSAPFDGEDWDNKEDLKDFRDIPFDAIDFSAILKKVDSGLILHSKDDDVVSFGDALKYKEKLGFELIEVEDAGHFDGPREEVREAIQKVIHETK